MDDAAAMREVQSRAELRTRRQRLRERHRRPVLDPRRERLPLEELHDDERVPLVFTVVEEGDDVAVLKAGDGAGFTIEPGAAVRVVREVGQHHFDGHFPFEHRIACAIKRTHPAARDALEDLVPPDGSGDIHAFTGRSIDRRQGSILFLGFLDSAEGRSITRP